MDEKEIKVMVCGLGRIGWRHAVCARETDGSRLVAVCDASEEVCQKAAEQWDVPAFGSLEAMLEEGEADLLVIASPSHLHFEMTKAGLEKGCHVMVEKPMADDAGQAYEMIRMAREKGLYLTVNQSLRYQSDAMEVFRLVRSGAIGEVRSVYRGINEKMKERTDWQIWRKYNGGAVANRGVHLLDALLQVVSSPPTEVFASMQRIIDQGDAEDAYKIVVKFADDTIGEVEAYRGYFNKPYWLVCGTEGTILVEQTAPVAGIQMKNRSGEESVKEVNFATDIPKLDLHYRELIGNLRKGLAPPVDPLQVLTQIQIVDAARESQAQGGSVALPREIPSA